MIDRAKLTEIDPRERQDFVAGTPHLRQPMAVPAICSPRCR
jgi:hypothetical protein